MLVIGSLGVGLGVTLWLSTDAAERSYQLGHARETNQALLQQKEALEREVLEAQAAPALAEAARNLGMIPSRDTAHLVQDPSGNWIVVGTPKPAEGVAAATAEHAAARGGSACSAAAGAAASWSRARSPSACRRRWSAGARCAGAPVGARSARSAAGGTARCRGPARRHGQPPALGPAGCARAPPAERARGARRRRPRTRRCAA